MQDQLLQSNPILLAGFFVAGLCSNVAIWKAVAEVNPRLPEDQKFSWWWWTINKYVRLWKAHERLCPESRWRFYGALSMLMAVVFLISIVASTPAFHTPVPKSSAMSDRSQ